MEGQDNHTGQAVSRSGVPGRGCHESGSMQKVKTIQSLSSRKQFHMTLGAYKGSRWRPEGAAPGSTAAVSPQQVRTGAATLRRTEKHKAARGPWSQSTPSGLQPRVEPPPPPCTCCWNTPELETGRQRPRVLLVRGKQASETSIHLLPIFQISRECRTASGQTHIRNWSSKRVWEIHF